MNVNKQKMCVFDKFEFSLALNKTKGVGLINGNLIEKFNKNISYRFNIQNKRSSKVIREHIESSLKFGGKEDEKEL